MSNNISNFQKFIIIFVAILLSAFFTSWLWRVRANNQHEETCFCHNVNHNPHTICTDDQGWINGHLGHVNNGTDTLGECVAPTVTPTPTVTPSPTPIICPSGTYPNIYVHDDWEGYDLRCLLQVTPTPTVVSDVTPDVTSQPLSDALAGPAFQCSDPTPAVKPWNCNLYRYPDHADLFWVPGDGALVDVKFRENHISEWVHSLPGLPNTGRATADHLVPGEAYTFTIVGRNACSSGKAVSCVIVDDPSGFFQTSYWGVR